MALPKLGSSRLLEHLDRVGISRTDLAKRLGVSKAFISKVINGEKNFSYERSYQVSVILECEMDELHHWIY